MTAIITLRKPVATQDWDAAQEQMVAVPSAPYAAVVCRVQSVSLDRAGVVAAEDPEAVSAYLVTVPATVNALEGDLGTISDSDDAALDGRDVTVVQVIRGSLRFERDLLCTLIA